MVHEIKKHTEIRISSNDQNTMASRDENGNQLFGRAKARQQSASPFRRLKREREHVVDNVGTIKELTRRGKQTLVKLWQ